MSNKSFIVSAASNSFAASLDYVVATKIWEKFDESCLIQQKLTFTQEEVVNIYIVYEISVWPRQVDSVSKFFISCC